MDKRMRRGRVREKRYQWRGNTRGETDGGHGGEERMTDLETATETFIAAVLETEEYRAYKTELEKVKREPELKAQIDEFRRQNYEFQSSPDCDFGKLDRFEKEYENFRQNPLVADFLAAELAFCRLMQRLNIRIIDGLDFE